MCVVECVGVGALSFLCIYQPESVLNGFMNGFLCYVCVSCLCVQTARISFHINRYNQLLLNFFLFFFTAQQSSTICSFFLAGTKFVAWQHHFIEHSPSESHGICQGFGEHCCFRETQTVIFGLSVERLFSVKHVE